MPISPAEKRALYLDMLRIRQVELKIDALYWDNNMKTPIHLYIGQESISAGICAHLTHDDPMFTTYRSHGQYLSKGGDMNAMMAELHCKATGCSGGFGGSMHLIDLSVGHYGSSAIVAGGIPIATGMALAQKMQNKNTVTSVFFGDGASDEGAFFESVNFAMLKKLPILFVLENNQWAVCSAIATRKVGENLFHSADQEHLFSQKINGNDVLEVYDAAEKAIAHVRSGQGPAFMECVTYRVRPHGGSGYDVKLGYRTQEEIDEWEAKDPLYTFRDALIQDEVISQGELDILLAEVDAEVDAAFAFAEASPLPKDEDLMKYVYRD